MKLDVSDLESLRPVLAEVVRQTVEQLQAADKQLGGGELSYPESRAAELLGVRPHVLRDFRLAGKIEYAKLGRRILYSRQALLEWLAKGGSE